MGPYKNAILLVVVCWILVVFIVSPIVQIVTQPIGPIGSEWANGSIHASSSSELWDNFVKAHRFLEQKGFNPGGQPDFMLGKKSGWIVPSMITLYYVGSYQGSKPFWIRIDLDPSGNNLIPYVEASASSKEAYVRQEKAARAFLDLFAAQMSKNVAAVDDHR